MFLQATTGLVYAKKPSYCSNYSVVISQRLSFAVSFVIALCLKGKIFIGVFTRNSVYQEMITGQQVADHIIKYCGTLQRLLTSQMEVSNMNPSVNIVHYRVRCRLEE